MEAAFRAKIEEERAKEKAAQRARTRAMKQALKEVRAPLARCLPDAPRQTGTTDPPPLQHPFAAHPCSSSAFHNHIPYTRPALRQQASAMKYTEDKSGNRVAVLDPFGKLMKEQKRLQAETEQAMRDRDADLAAKEAAFMKRQKAEAAQRAANVEAAQREVAAILSKSKEKELEVKLEMEREQEERFRRIAKQMREEIEEDNQRQLEAERQAAQTLKQVKTAQYEAALYALSRLIAHTPESRPIAHIPVPSPTLPPYRPHSRPIAHNPASSPTIPPHRPQFRLIAHNPAPSPTNSPLLEPTIYPIPIPIIIAALLLTYDYPAPAAT